MTTAHGRGRARPRPSSGAAAPRDEDELVRRLAAIAGEPGGAVTLGIGDDAALLRAPVGAELVWTVDMQEEGVDFRRAWMSLEEVGARAVAAALSDLAAMAAAPLGLLLALGTSAAEPADELLALFRGACAAGRRWGAPVAGGDVTRRRGGMGIAVTALGAVRRGRALRRDGARPGDELWVTGTPGLASRGLRLLRRHGRAEADRRDHRAVAAFVDPAPRVAEASWLADHAALHAGLDLSDGISRDLPRLCSASRVGAVLERDLLQDLADDSRRAPARRPRSRGSGASSRARTGLAATLRGGEDFELLLAAPAGALAPLAAPFERRFGVPLRRVGAVLAGAGVRLQAGARTWQLPAAGFDHLARSSRAGGRRPAATAARPRRTAHRHTGGSSA